MPGVDRLSVDLVAARRRKRQLGIPVIALFPYTDRPENAGRARSDQSRQSRLPRRARDQARGAGNRRALRRGARPYTSHGHDGVLVDGYVANDETVDILVRQALVQAEAGCDIIAPSDMMDGRVGAIRTALEAGGFKNTLIMAYAAKYASAFYGPFRDAVGSGSR